ncbi:MAG: Rieske 2Fe-2S domain-containing protein [Gammaproteobacteria bacterium]
MIPATEPRPSEPDLESLLKDLRVLEELVESWDDESRRNTVMALKNAVDALNKAAFARLIRALKAEPAALEALKAAVSDEVVYAVLRHHELVKPSLHERIEQALASVRPMLASHGGDVELVRVEPPDAVEIRLLGACDGGDRTPVHFVSPFARCDDSGWLPACDVGAIPEGSVLPLEVAGEPLLLSRRGHRVFCYRNACAHLGMPLDMADVSDGVLTCPHHGFQYSLETGECLTVPEVQLQTHAVRVTGERVEVKLS